MKGIVFNVLQEIVQESAGEEAWDDVIERAGVSGVYTSLGSYSDDELGAIASVLAADAGLSIPDALRWVGEQSIPHFHTRYPRLFDHDGTLAMVLALNRIIHPEVYKLYPGAEPPQFEYTSVDAQHLQIKYISRRQMCTFAEGLVLGAAKIYNESVEVSQSSCKLRGDAECLIEIRVTGDA